MYEFFLTDSMAKVFPAERPRKMGDSSLVALQGEVPAVQLVYYKDSTPENELWRRSFTVEVVGAPVPARLRQVELVPSDFPAYEKNDDNYITKHPGLFPDLLATIPDGKILPLAEQYRSVWIDFPTLQDVPAGSYTVEVKIAAEVITDIPNGTIMSYPADVPTQFTCSFVLQVLDAKLPEQTLLHTEWFHADGLAQYYNVPVFSEAHWQLIEKQVEMAGQELGVNMLLTPVFTPPLDTAVGGERLTVQLVDITVTNGTYSFVFDKLERWCNMCRKYGITHLEIAHFFTQWGAYATPKIVAIVNGEETRIFGWHVPSTSPEYRAFLEQFVPALQEVLDNFGYDNNHVVYHISDEPSEAHIESYKAAKDQIADLLDGCYIMDALSDYTYYENGLVEHPVPANDHIEPFIENKVPNLWVYYCCAQCVDVANRFFSMPSERNRVMGMLMYLYDIKGFLQWGYNFYNSQFSLKPINPYVNTHASYAFPSGDPYLVYPGDDGALLSSIRAQVHRQGLDDMRALQLLETYIGREAVEAIIYEDIDYTITFKKYPIQADYFIRLRARVAQELAKH